MKRKYSRGERAVLFLCTLVLVFASVFGFDFRASTVKADGEVFTITFQATGTHTVTSDGQHISVDNGIVELRENGNAVGEVSNNGSGTESITVSVGREVEINYGGQNFTLYNTDGHVAYTMGTKLSSSAVFVVEDYANPGGNNGGGGSALPPAATGSFNVNVTQSIPGFTGKMVIEFYNKADMDHPLLVREYSGNATDSIPADANTVLIQFDPNNVDGCLRNFKNGWYEIVRGEQRYAFDVFDEIRENENHVFVLNSESSIFTGGQSHVQGMDIDPSTDSLNFRFEFDDTRNVSWSYDPSAPADQYVEHCRIYKLTGDDPTAIVDGTDHNLRIGEDFYFLLVPDYGYQVNGLMVNGHIPIQPMNSMGVFKFSMIDQNFHFNAMVSPSEDITDASDSKAVSGISIANGANATTEHGGNLKVTVADAPTEDVSNVVEGAVLSTVDIDIDNIVSKGNDTYWSSDVTEITNDVDVTLQLAGAPAGQYAVVRNHNGTLTKVDATYDATTGALTFPSNKFSTYTIVRTDIDEDAKVSTSSSTGKAVTVTALTSGVEAAKSTAPKSEVSDLTKTASAGATANGHTVEAVVEFNLEGAVPANGVVTVSVKGFGVKPGDPVWAYHFSKTGLKMENCTVTGEDQVTLSGLTDFSPFVLVKINPNTSAAQATAAAASAKKSPKTGQCFFDFKRVLDLL